MGQALKHFRVNCSRLLLFLQVKYKLDNFCFTEKKIMIENCPLEGVFCGISAFPINYTNCINFVHFFEKNKIIKSIFL